MSDKQKAEIGFEVWRATVPLAHAFDIVRAHNASDEELLHFAHLAFLSGFALGEAGGHCSTCICGKRAPVQGSYRGSYTGERHQRKQGEPGHGDGTISWEEHLLAYASYANRYGRSQTAERLAERGGFGWFELVEYLGREPTTWRPAR